MRFFNAYKMELEQKANDLIDKIINKIHSFESENYINSNIVLVSSEDHEILLQHMNEVFGTKNLNTIKIIGVEILSCDELNSSQIIVGIKQII